MHWPDDADVEAIERATVAAVAPEALDEWNGWLLPFDSGTVGRAKSAVPLRHASAEAGAIDALEARYAARGFAPALRLCDAPCFDALRTELERRGYAGNKPTWVQIGTARQMQQRLPQAEPAAVERSPDGAWAALFVGEGFDPVDGASRVRALSRAADSLYASVRENGRTLAAGAMAFGHGWASIHGMRTAPTHRGQGLAARVLAGLAQAALARGVQRVFLQVEAGNAPALALYRRAGFESAWQYRYWQRDA